MKKVILTAAGFLTVLSFAVSSFAATNPKATGNSTRSKVVLLKKIDLKDFGSVAGLRLGDLNGDGGVDILLGFRRGGSIDPTLYDGHGQVVASFPFPDIENLHLAQHADIVGDEREEIIVFNEKMMYIYTNGAANPNKLLYNYTQYIGMP